MAGFCPKCLIHNQLRSGNLYYRSLALQRGPEQCPKITGQRRGDPGYLSTCQFRRGNYGLVLHTDYMLPMEFVL